MQYNLIVLFLSAFSITSLVITKNAKAFEEVPIYLSLYDGTEMLVAYGDSYGKTIRPCEDFGALHYD